MPDSRQSPILWITRGLILVIMALLAVATGILVMVAAALPFYWDEAVREIALKTPNLDAAALYPRIYAVFALGFITLALILAIMRKLQTIVGSVALGDPFVLANAARLKTIGWLMVAVQLIGIPLALAAGEAVDLFGKNNVGYEFSLNGILSILLVFVLAGVFERGAQMREELEGTV